MLIKLQQEEKKPTNIKNNSLNKFYIVEKYFELKAIHNI